MSKWEAEVFFVHVTKSLGIEGWNLEWYKATSREGFCWRSRKVVNLGPANTRLESLILHEIAHIEYPNHGVEWQNWFRKLGERFGVDVEDDSCLKFASFANINS